MGYLVIKLTNDNINIQRELILVTKQLSRALQLEKSFQGTSGARSDRIFDVDIHSSQFRLFEQEYTTIKTLNSFDRVKARALF